MFLQTLTTKHIAYHPKQPQITLTVILKRSSTVLSKDTSKALITIVVKQLTSVSVCVFILRTPLRGREIQLPHCTGIQTYLKMQRIIDLPLVIKESCGAPGHRTLPRCPKS